VPQLRTVAWRLGFGRFRRDVVLAVRNTGPTPRRSGTHRGVDVQLTSSPRRALGLLAAGTIGLSTALLGVTGVAQAAAAVPNAPTIDAIAGGDGMLGVFFLPNNPVEGDTTTPVAETWEYDHDDDGLFDPATVGDRNGYLYFEIDGLDNGEEYSVVLRGAGEDSGNVWRVGEESEPKTGIPYVAPNPVGAAPVVTVGPASVTVTWTAPAAGGTFPVTGYQVNSYADSGFDGGPVRLCETDAATLSCTAAVTPGWKYTIYVNAVDSKENRSADSPMAAKTAAIPGTAVPAAVPAKNGDLTLPAGTSSTVEAGKTVTVKGSGYMPGSAVTVAIYSTPQVLTTTVADINGEFTVTVTVPAGLAAGSHTLVAAGVDSSGAARYVNLVVTVTADGGAKLANTGADVTLPALGGIAALGLGAGLIVVSRRRSAA
jgi:LPXTG-motif cell wall-anchored protein